jgi:hypothetical protein
MEYLDYPVSLNPDIPDISKNPMAWSDSSYHHIFMTAMNLPKLHGHRNAARSSQNTIWTKMIPVRVDLLFRRKFIVMKRNIGFDPA